MTAPTGIFGGTFDPVHNAHLRVARVALEALGLVRLLWIPTGAPRYRPAPVASAEHRLAMLELALAGEPRYAIDARELRPEASGYTVDTLAALRAELGPHAPLVLLMGSDQYEKLAGWHRWRELFGLTRIAVVARPGRTPEADARIRAAGPVLRVEMAPLDVSSTEIRARMAHGEDVSGMLPPPVHEYISTHRLYR
ncbi:MAG: nicotinate (nicotinamide) nucleotide adenylyltransferase [Burkholderiales bacterium]